MSIPLHKALQIAAVAWAKMRTEGTSLERALAYATKGLSAEDKSASQSVLYNATRHWAKLDVVTQKLISREPPIETKCLLEVSLALLLNGKENHFTVVNQAVQAAKNNPATVHGAGFINAVLRNFLRSRAQLTKGFATNLSTRFNAPGWWISKIRKAYPQDWEAILTTQTLPPPMTLRINQRRTTMSAYCQTLVEAGINATPVSDWGLVLDRPRPVSEIPGFQEGVVSVQDAGSQMVPQFLQPAIGQKVLDACSAPGGKTAHLLEAQDITVTAVEVDPDRAKKIDSTLSRLGLKAEIIVSDAADVKKLEKAGPFDAILLDAPCTASGIVRRHPDIVWMRRPEDIQNLAAQQRKLLDAMWSILPAGKKLLYATCSIFPEEGPLQVERFLADHPDAQATNLPGLESSMLRLIPTDKEKNPSLPLVHDGFFYALITKKEA
ncbi:MAG: 16S rRNA (cytosine(967)-C(5))-methyltransferase RsmB [Burkholderiaceae bacterium]|nr:16S rRNA (cytosine(967)-C(5))-methyltransferase RsmB [Burkholderiaceae bacterium]